MNTKRAIEYINSLKWCYRNTYNRELLGSDDKINDVIEQLQLWEGFKKKYEKYTLSPYNLGDDYVLVVNAINEIEQKLFKDVTIEIEAKNIKDMANSLRDIGNFVNIKGSTKMKIIDISKFKKGGS